MDCSCYTFYRLSFIVCVEDTTGGRLAQPFRAFPTGATFGFAYLHHYAICRVALDDNADLDQ